MNRITSMNMSITRSSLLSQSLRQYTTRSTRQDRIGSAAAIGYWCAVVSAPLAGAFVISQNAAKDQRYAKQRPLSFRDCLPASALDDYAGAFMKLRR
ncbi:hypothetical protein CLAFUW4_07373 [Fulvia fulva]|uniref:Uncharacterized protein n=1 Tax=Passalora fulva TaxID=5499 RepID=A0A9Q8P9W7_PASFU|nr:uncharacterized protein CLAFUR5_07502 [Fulvia fulva]KAK4622350.1 hypothetical protein CLAFUR4_07380 [Fulvia fulva]KAK4622490.1 hypothetical protein CLAFUR0_07378 [Fulvia fulva]UJO18572.1 hypothetical protein CLAFUR5_07502 [Fulvia fulva]WPV16121.1 hypothetical protein CLAFUW4_07373 [Fulvia fulva]WPV31183.1 hypothetical protein CLAFUW7_07375 [Fulvia fulva]